MNTAARTREIGTLRALGFSKASILTAFVVESTCLAIVGGALRCLLALPADGMTSAAMSTNFGEIGFAFRISGTSLVVGMVLAVLDGCRGRRVARVPRGTDADHGGAERRLEHSTAFRERASDASQAGRRRFDPGRPLSPNPLRSGIRLSLPRTRRQHRAGPVRSVISGLKCASQARNGA